MSSMLETQKALGESFAELAQKSPGLIDEFTKNAETQHEMIKRGETLISKKKKKKYNLVSKLFNLFLVIVVYFFFSVIMRISF
jgi:hypothetical protein